MRTLGISTLVTLVALAAAPARAIYAQEPQPATRQTVIEQAQQEKVANLSPLAPSEAERVMDNVQDLLTNGLRWHPFFESAYAGGGFTLGAGYMRHVSSYSTVDVRGSYTLKGYRRAEVAFTAPHLFDRRATLSLLGGWREATEVGFYGIGTDNTSNNDRANYAFEQPYASADLTFWPTRRLLMLRGNAEWTQWKQKPGQGRAPAVETLFTPETLPGLGARPTYLHTQGTVGLDWRTSSGYSRRGGFYGVTAHDFRDSNDAFGFRQLDYEVVQHIPILREAWVISLRGLAQTTFDNGDQQIPFFMLPSLGGGSTLRGFSSWRFRDRHSLLLQAEWRVMVNRFFDSAVFYDAGKVAARRSDLDLEGLKSDYGFGLRFHGPTATMLRADVAKSNEGLRFVFTVSPVF